MNHFESLGNDVLVMSFAGLTCIVDSSGAWLEANVLEAGHDGVRLLRHGGRVFGPAAWVAQNHRDTGDEKAAQALESFAFRCLEKAKHELDHS